jgi:hypothetical protein
VSRQGGITPVILQAYRSWLGGVGVINVVVMLELEQCRWPDCGVSVCRRTYSVFGVSSEHSSFRCDSILELD